LEIVPKAKIINVAYAKSKVDKGEMKPKVSEIRKIQNNRENTPGEQVCVHVIIALKNT